ncbi:copper resistance CopC/CopD family protein [Phaeacidiphilus oryzae]|uniref:copper resistance CopC/CopD family protein n=1 Tax=Phaeacidiphilus oryzae TaxID=348818 RepID=UPI00068B84BF|nr:copper resistance protein CopC [Phaeacidiphilus oryzae]
MSGTRTIGGTGARTAAGPATLSGLVGLLGLLGLLLGLMLAGATPASAHAALLSTTPDQGSVVESPPTQVLLHFSEQVTLSTDAVRVFDPAGRRVDTGPSGHAGGDQSSARVALDSGLAQGTYTVSWRAVSADTHPVSGAWTFSVGHASATTSVAGEQAPHGSSAVGVLYGGSRFVSYAAYALLVGAGALVLLCWPGGIALRGVQRALLTGWVALLVGTVAQLLLRGPYAQASGLGRVFDLSLVQQTLGERLGTVLAVRILLLAAAGVVLAVLAPALERRHGRRWAGAAGAAVAVCLAATWALADHASVGMQVGLAVPVDIVHLLAMAGWLGGLVTLVVGLRRAESEGGADRAAVRRFSTLAFWSVAALAASGTYQAWRGLGSWSAFTDTDYGRLLLVKLGCVAVILGAAYLSRTWTATLSPPPDAEQAEGLDTESPTRDAETGKATPGREATGGEEAPEAGKAAEAGGAAHARGAAHAGEASEGSQGAEGPAGAAVAEGGGGVGAPEGAAAAAGGGERAAQLARQRRARDDAARRRARQAVPARGMLIRSTLLEAVFAVVVLVVTTLLTNTAPGRAVAAASAGAGSAAQAASGPASATVAYDTGGTEAGARGKVEVEIDPGRTGANAVHAYVVGADGKPVDVPELDLSLTLPAQRLGPLPVRIEKVDLGHWSAAGFQLPMAGDWQLAVTVRSSDIDEVTRTARLRIG